MQHFPVDSQVFLSIQSLLNHLKCDFADTIDASAIFFRGATHPASRAMTKILPFSRGFGAPGNLIFSSIDQETLRLLYMLMRLREEHGMEMEEETDKADPSTQHQGFWMTTKYTETFLPVWSSKRSYAECLLVRKMQQKKIRLVVFLSQKLLVR